MLLSIFQTPEFYVITAGIAAAIVAYAALPSHRGPARQTLCAGTLLFGLPPSEPAIEVQVDADGSNLTIRRLGLEGINADGAYSVAVTVAGFDITVNERLTPGRRVSVGRRSVGAGITALEAPDGADMPPTAAEVTITGFAPERYHFRYESEATGRSAAFYLTLTPGARATRLLT